MSDEKVITKEWCMQARENCYQRSQDRFDMMKELFTSRLDGIEDQLESMFSDIQGVLSNGSIRMNTIEETITKTKETMVQELETFRADIHRQELKTATSNRYTIPQIISMCCLLVVVGGSLIGTWGLARINSSQIVSMKHQQETFIKEVKAHEEKEGDTKLDDLAQAISELAAKIKP